MKITCMLQVPYRQLPDDFEKRFESVVTTMPPTHGSVESCRRLPALWIASDPQRVGRLDRAQ